MSNVCWLGQKQALLTVWQVTASWARGNWSSLNRDFVNRAFEFWFNVRREIAKVTDLNYRGAPTAKLEDSGEEGWGTGIDDFEEAFEHIAKNKATASRR